MAKKPKQSTPNAAGEVGYGRPPKATQFKPGQSGNPKGRPKGSLNMASVLARALRERVSVTEAGKRRTFTKLEVAVKQLVNKAASGEPRAMQMLVSLSQMAEAQTEVAAVVARDALPEDDQQVLQSLLARIQHHAKGTDDVDPAL